MSEPAIEVTLVTEAYNLAEGQGWDDLVAAASTIESIARTRPGVEAILVDPSGDPRVPAYVAGRARLRHLPTPGLGYDAQKTVAAEQARGRYVVYLDGDCTPLREDWLDRLLGPLRDGTAIATGGSTFYDDRSPLGIACTIMDFGYLWDSDDGTLGCYASNNVAFERVTRCAIPPPDSGIMRCNCYAHAQLLKRRGTPVRYVEGAIVVHALPDVARERHRRGYDLVASCWSDPLLPETCWLGAGADAAMRFLDQAIRFDAQRFHAAPPELGLDDTNRDAVAAEILRLRELDLGGMHAALAEGAATGRNAHALEAHGHWQAARRAAAGGATGHA